MEKRRQKNITARSSKKYLIYYLATKNKLLVVGLLHDQQSHPEHLEPEKYIERIIKLGEMLAKVKLTSAILEIIEHRKLTQHNAAKILDTDQAYISKLKEVVNYAGRRFPTSYTWVSGQCSALWRTTMTNYALAWLYNPRISATVSHNENCWFFVKWLDIYVGYRGIYPL